MAKIFFSVLILSTLAITAMGQTTKTQLDQAKNNPQTTQNAAKADVQVASKNNVTANPSTMTVLSNNKKKMFKKKRTSPKRSS